MRRRWHRCWDGPWLAASAAGEVAPTLGHVSSGVLLLETLDMDWLTGRAGEAALESGQRPLTSAIPVNLAPATPIAGGLSGGTPVPEGTLLWGEAASSAWTATADGRELRRATAFGAANAYAVPATGPVALHNSWQWTRWVMVALQLGLWLAVIVGLGRARVVGALRARRAANRAAREASGAVVREEVAV